jgi:SH3 domain-containing YSC84-like protein 1
VKSMLVIIALGLLAFPVAAAAQEASAVGDRVVSAAIVLKEIAGIPEKGIPQDLLDKCACVAIIPSMKKAGFIVGGNYGKGIISCRTNSGTGPWSAPAMILVGGGSFGLQIGAQSVDLILVIMNLSGLESLLDSKFTLGGDVSVAAGPVGRTASAQTDAWMSAKILAYSRARGLFGGIALKGDAVRPDNDANLVLYGKGATPKGILFGSNQTVPKDAKILIDELTRISPKQKNN